MAGRKTQAEQYTAFILRGVLCPSRKSGFSKCFLNLSLSLPTLRILPTTTPSVQYLKHRRKSASRAALFQFSSTQTPQKKPPPSCTQCSATQKKRLFCHCRKIPLLMAVKVICSRFLFPGFGYRGIFYQGVFYVYTRNFNSK